MAAVSITARADVWLEAAKTIKGGVADSYASKPLTFTFDDSPTKASMDITLPDGKKKNH